MADPVRRVLLGFDCARLVESLDALLPGARAAGEQLDATTVEAIELVRAWAAQVAARLSINVDSPSGPPPAGQSEEP